MKLLPVSAIFLRRLPRIVPRTLVCAGLLGSLLGCGADYGKLAVGTWVVDPSRSSATETSVKRAAYAAFALELRADRSYRMRAFTQEEGRWRLEGDLVELTPNGTSAGIRLVGNDRARLRVAGDGRTLVAEASNLKLTLVRRGSPPSAQ